MESYDYDFIQKYINDNINFSDNKVNNLVQFKKLSKLFLNIESIPSSEMLAKIIRENTSLELALSIFIKDNIELISSNRIEDVTKSPFLICLIEVYCKLNNIFIKDVDDSVELINLLKEEKSNIDSSDYIEDTLSSYFRAIDMPLLTPEESLELVIKSKNGDIEARNKLVERNLRLVIRVARKYRGYNVPFLDLIQNGNIGLLMAVEKFDVSKGVKFTTYAIFRILQSIGRTFINTNNQVRLPIGLFADLRKLNKARELLYSELKREASDYELKEYLNWTDYKFNRVSNAYVEVISYNIKLNEDSEEEFVDFFPSVKLVEDEYFITSMQEDVRNLIEFSPLSEKEKNVLYLRYGIGYDKIFTLMEIASMLDLSYQRIQGIEKKAIEKLIIYKKTINLSDYLDYPERARLTLEKKRREIKAKKKSKY